MTESYNSWRGHVIVCGLHGVGLRIVEELSLSGVPAVVVDDQPDPGLAGIMAGWGVPRLDASPRSADALTAAGLAGATAVICAPRTTTCTRWRPRCWSASSARTCGSWSSWPTRRWAGR